MDEAELPVIKGVSAVIDTGTEWVLQIRDNIDGILWPGKIALWGGLLEVEDEGSFKYAMLRELREELSLFPEDIELTPISVKTARHGRTDGTHSILHLKIYLARLVKERALHVYEGAGLFRIEQAGFPQNTSEQNFAPYALETIHQLHHMNARSVEV